MPLGQIQILYEYRAIVLIYNICQIMREYEIGYPSDNSARPCWGLIHDVDFHLYKENLLVDEKS